MATTPTFTPVSMPALPTPPPPPSLPVQNPSTLPRQSFLRDMLDPSKATYLGNKYRPELQGAGRDLQAGLEGFGRYSFSEDAQGTLTPKKEEGGQPGRHYRDAYFDARSQAAAAGMLYSRTAEQAVGTAWHRLSEQERALLNQYSAQASEILGRMASDFTGVTNELIGLYGEDIRYALEHPILPPEPDPAPADGGGGGAPGAGVAARRWVGEGAPNLQTLSKAWGVPISQIRVTRSGAKTGRKFVATATG
jgi:hypothetical protein